MSQILPSFLHAPTDFAPQTLHVGDTFRLNNSLFSYTIVSAFDALDNRKPVSSFPYYNSPFSESCDVTNLTASVTRTLGHSTVPYQYYGYDVAGSVTCTRPTVFQMTWNISAIPPLDDAGFDGVIHNFGRDLEFQSAGARQRNWGGHSPSYCSPVFTTPARFIPLSGNVRNTTALTVPWGYDYNWNGSNITDLFAGLNTSYRDGYIGAHDLSALDGPFQNMFQVFYHLVRSDLGVILDNQIYTSPEIFNGSIAAVTVPQNLIGFRDSPFGTITPSTADTMRAATSNVTLMAQWRDAILAFNQSDRVPVLEYLRPVQRLKPVGSAITSVFASTFAMVSTVWTIFSFVAGMFVRSARDDTVSMSLREAFVPPPYEGKRGYEDVEEGETSTLTSVCKHPDERLDTVCEQLESLLKQMDRMENNRAWDANRRGTVDGPEAVESGK
ncbi:hypothetical protein DFH06DRAFT_1147565 [Mycena polygramma]|nr:hypothetical protein DFH06DRAFT_1147565 [Mycena polygramma]